MTIRSSLSATLRMLVGILPLILIFPPPVRAADLEPGLVAHWDFNEAVGSTVAHDVTANGHDTTVLTAATFVASPRGNALRFNGTNATVTYGNFATMNLSGNVTLAVWLKTDSSVAPATTRLIFGDVGSAITLNLSLRLDSYNMLRFEWGNGTTYDYLTCNGTLLDGSWKHVVVTTDTTTNTAILYVDGVEVARKIMIIPITQGATTPRRSSGYWSAGNAFYGDLDDIRLYSRTLDPTEVMQLCHLQADVLIGDSDPKRPIRAKGDGLGRMALTLQNWTGASRDVTVSVPGVGSSSYTLANGTVREVELYSIALRAPWTDRTDLLMSMTPVETDVTIAVAGGETTTKHLGPQTVVKPIQLILHDPWQKVMPAGKTNSLTCDVKMAIAAELRQSGTLDVSLWTRAATPVRILQELVPGPQAMTTTTLDVTSVPYGAYDLIATLTAGTVTVASTKVTATILPDSAGHQKIRVLNNLVSELMNASTRDLLASTSFDFMNPRDGWVWFCVAGSAATWTLDGQALPIGTSGEAMRNLAAGKHTLVRSTGTLTELRVHAIPALVYNIYPSSSQLTRFGPNDWGRLAPYVRPNANMLESAISGTVEQIEWLGAGKCWLQSVDAPGMRTTDTTEWTESLLLDYWLAKANGYSGMQINEYYSGAAWLQYALPTAFSIAKLADHPSFSGKQWIPLLSGNAVASPDNAILETTLAAGWPFGFELYMGEQPTKAGNLASLSGNYLRSSSAFENAIPGCLRKMILMPMYAYLPYCTTNCSPQADFRVHLEMQMQIMANDPAFFGLYGIEPYRSNYVDEEILNVMAKLLGHYAIEGNTTPFLTDPYELKHIANPDFADGLTSWTVSPAEVNSIIAGNYTGYGNLQGRYPGNNAINNTFAIMTRSAGAPNSLGQQIQGLQNGRLYSLKLITGDYKNLTGNVSSNAAQVLKITVDNGASDLVVATPARFSQKFKSWFTVNGFNSTHPYWMTYHWLQFRATGPTAQLTIKDWQSDTTPGGPAAQQVMVNFVEIQPVLEEQIQSLETWLAYRGVPEADRGPLADPNGDGMPNLLAYALNIHPLQGIKVPGGNASPQYSIYQLNGTNYLALDYRVNRYATGINVQVELSQTLAQNSWAVPGTLVITPNGTDPVTKDQLFRATVELSGLPRAFLRLNVSTQNP